MSQEEKESKQIKKKRQGGFLIGLLLVFLFPYYTTLFLSKDLAGTSLRQTITEISIQKTDGRIVSLEAVLPWIVAGQVPLELLKTEDVSIAFFEAQSIIARTILVHMLAPGQTVLLETELEERIMDKEELIRKWGKERYESCYPMLLSGVINTKGQLLFYQGEVALPMYHLSNAGKSRTHSSFPYMPSINCTWDLLAPYSLSIVNLSKIEYPQVSLWQVDPDGYCEEIALGDYHMTAEEFAADYNLRSEYFVIEETEEYHRILIYGNGHAYGLSQWSAMFLAKEGKNYREILAYFFPGCKIALQKESRIFAIRFAPCSNKIGASHLPRYGACTPHLGEASPTA